MALNNPSRKNFLGTLILAMVAAALPAPAAMSQSANPVYFDDAPTAVDTMERIRQLSSIGNTDEAVRVLQQLLQDSAELLVVSEGDPDLFIPVRDRLHAMLKKDETLSGRYRELMSARASAEFAKGRIERVARWFFMTPSGVQAVLRLSQHRIEQAQFYAAWHTLAQLEGHPALTDDSVARAAKLAASIVAYLDAQHMELDDDDRALAAAWMSRAGLRAQPAPRTPEQHAAIGPNDPIDRIDIAGLLPSPLWSVDVGGKLDLRPRLRNEQPDIPDNARVLYMIPAVDEQSIYVNDGYSITSWNRFSLSERWHTQVVDLTSRRIGGVRGRPFTDSSSVAVRGDWLVGVMGVSVSGNNSKRRIAALDARTGRVRWSHSVEEFGIDELARGEILGPPIIDQRTVVLTVVKDLARRRLHSIYAIGLDLVTGEPLWSRAMGSVGKLPYGTAVSNGDLASVEQGIVYRSDRIGFTVAFESVTGRVRWARRFDYTQLPGRFTAQAIWGLNKPIVIGERLFLLNPERSLLHEIEKDTGLIEAQYPTSRMAKPDYILRAGDVLVGVNPVDIYLVPIDELGDASAYQHALIVPEPGIRGRVVSSDRRLVIPTATGVYHADPAAVVSGAQEEFEFVKLDRPGSIIPLDEELLVVDDRQVHTYLLWESAQQVLAERIAEDPNNAAHPVTYAELAFRAGRTSLVVKATDDALRAIEREPLSPRNETARARLFSALLDMIDPPIGTRVERELTVEQRNDVLVRLQLCASTPRETVAYLMIEGSVAESLKDASRALDAYQRILQTPSLAQTMHFSHSRSVPADVEATRRLRSLISLYSREIYRSYDAEALRALDALASSRDPRDFEAAARRYPVAKSAPAAWLAASERYERQGLTRFVISALDEALRSARDVLEPGDPLTGALAGKLVTKLVETDHLDRALDLLKTLEEPWARSTLSVRGVPIDRAALERGIRSTIASRDQRPVIGNPVGSPASILGWALLDIPEAMSQNVPTDRIPMLSADGTIAVFGVDERGEFRNLWSGIEQGANELISFSTAGALFATRDKMSVIDRSFTMHDLDTGRQLWKTQPFFSVFDKVDTRAAGRPDEMGRPIPRFDTPLLPNLRATTLIHATSPSTLVVVSAAGLAAAFDRSSGALLWREKLDVNRVHAVALDGSTLAVAGISTEMPLSVQDENGIGIAAGDHIVELFDARTGVRLTRHTESSAIRWITFTVLGDLVAGTERSIVAIAPTRKAPLWRMQQVNELKGSVRAWSMHGRILVQGINGAIWQLDPRTGRALTRPVIADDIVSGQWLDHALVRVGENACFVTDMGLTLLAPDGMVAGVDARSISGQILPPAFASDRVVIISNQQIPIQGEIPMIGFELTIHSSDTCKLLAEPATVAFGSGHNSPDSIAVIDGLIIISSGSLTYLIDAPREDRP